MLAVVSYGAARTGPLPPGCPRVEVDLPALGAAALHEAWTVGGPVSYGSVDGIVAAWTDEILFGAAVVEETPAVPLEHTAFEAYNRIFRAIEREGYPSLLRVWNYVPDITEPAGGIERYRRFNLGRHDAFIANRRQLKAAPAACAVGGCSGPLRVYFIASRQSGMPLENPRQVSAYRYPPLYGPRSPTFSRALLAEIGGRPQLFISGTASVVGHESRHLGDPLAQTKEAMANIQSVVAEAQKMGLAADHRLMLKAYLRDPSDFSEIRDCIAGLLCPDDAVVFLQGRLCRSELLLEIEGVCF
jgi:chorismate lyase/3-hydroxybenzoate synthase